MYMNNKILAKFIKKKRIELCLSQKELATMLGFKSAQFISNLERGVSSIPVNKIKDFSKALQINQNDLTQIISSSYKNKLFIKNKISIEDTDNLFIDKIVFAYRTANEKDKELFKNIALKFFNIELD